VELNIMKKYLVGFFALLIFLVPACEKPTDEEMFYEIQKSLNNIDSYRCIADITIVGNKGDTYYKAKHIFKKPNKYIIEIIQPEEKNGYITIYDGRQAWLYHPGIEESFLIKDYQISLEKEMFVGYFLRNLITSESINIESESIDNDNYLVLSSEIPGNNRYRNFEKLWINKKSFLPYRLLILDRDGNIAIDIKYTEFNYDIKIEEDKFDIKTSIDFIRDL